VSARQKHQDVSRIVHRHRFATRTNHSFPDWNFTRRATTAVMGWGFFWTIKNIDGIGAATGFERDSRREKIGQACSFKRGRHHHHTEIRARAILQIETACERDIDRETALVEFIENNRADAMKLRVILDPALEYAIGEVENFGFISILRIEAHRMTNFATNARAALFCHPSGKQSRCHASGFDDENHALHARIKQHAGHFR
jgi:hypothetical protein